MKYKVGEGRKKKKVFALEGIKLIAEQFCCLLSKISEGSDGIMRFVGCWQLVVMRFCC